MLKQTITYTDFNDEVSTDTLYFNLTKTELTENLNLKERFEDLQRRFEGDIHELGVDDISSILDLVKTLMRISYGERSGDGKKFNKKPEVWDDFVQSAAYDAFLFELFQNPEKANAFMIGVLPKDLRDEAAAMAQKSNPVFISENGVDVGVTVPDDRPVWVKENRNPTPEEVRGMTPDELRVEYIRVANQI